MFERKTKYSLFSVQARFSNTVLYVFAFLWFNDFDVFLSDGRLNALTNQAYSSETIRNGF